MFKSITLNERFQIWRFIERMYQKRCEFEIWQGKEGLHIKEKNLTLGLISQLQFFDNKIIIEPKLSEFNFDIRDGKYLFFHSEYKDFLFKSKIVELSPYEISLAIPQSAQIIDERKFTRKTFTHHEHRFVEFSSHRENTNKRTVVKRRLCNLSHGGMAFFINRHEVFRYQNTEYIYINGKSINYKSHLIGKVRHITGVVDSLTGKTNFRVGIEFMANSY